ncbi:hypothetical protein OG413_38475 [Streptomyces sp. NBC_01433]|uniref:hypothetical protein n=1 Tax=Streptomyces sp. NBC_01433 TaxID=2903864 RepID=UPI00224D078C|nr:hypothetical protein [Streptomyces sp. NBC_01433]MCX4681095.1 hypothetical protein [Streptomyces sp. NBC_01433]
MVDTYSRGYVLAARRMFCSGILLFLLGLASLWAVTRHSANSWECDPACRLSTSTTWEVAEWAGGALAVLGCMLAVASFLMIRWRGPRTQPGKDGP